SYRKPAVCSRVENILASVGQCKRKVLRIVVVVQDDSSSIQVVEMGGEPGDVRGRCLSELRRPAALEQLDLAEARELGVFRYCQRIDKSDKHPFAGFVESIEIADDRQ